MSDITENMIHKSDAVSSPSSSSSDGSQGSSRTPTPTPPKRAPKNDPPGRLDGKLKNHKRAIFHPQKMIERQRENVECVAKKYQERN